MRSPTIDIATLTPTDRLRLMEQLWNSLSDENLPLCKAQEQELDRRLDDRDSEGPQGIPWEEVLRHLERQL